MVQQFPGAPQFKTRLALVLFVKGGSTPIALYTENPQADYEEIQKLLKTSSSAFFERDTLSGPIKKISLPVNQISAVALQEEQYA